MSKDDVTVVVCRGCGQRLAAATPGRIVIGGLVAIYRTVALNCLKCGFVTTWRQDGGHPSPRPRGQGRPSAH